MSKRYTYIVIDNDSQNNFVVSLVLKQHLDPLEVITFTNPEEGLSYIKESYGTLSNIPRTILLLDINMPEMSCWDFVAEFEKINEDIRTQFSIFLLTSSVDACDYERAKKTACVKGYLVKPLIKEKLLELLLTLPT
jgi:two-component system chemotaxis response regulator CheY